MGVSFFIKLQAYGKINLNAVIQPIGISMWIKTSGTIFLVSFLYFTMHYQQLQSQSQVHNSPLFEIMKSKSNKRNMNDDLQAL